MGEKVENHEAAETGQTPVSLDEIAKVLPDVRPDTLRTLHSIMRVYPAPAGTQLITEGDLTTSFYYIRKGHVVVYREAHDGLEERLLGDLHDGRVLGEISLLDGKPRSASARVAEDTDLIEFNPADILKLPNGEEILSDLRGSLAVAVTGRMREQNDKYIASMEREMIAIKDQQLFGQFFLYTMGVMAIGMVVNDILSNHVLKVNIYTQTFAWQYLMIILVPSFFVIRKMGIPFSELGWTKVGFKKSFWEGIVFSIISMAVVFAAAWAMEELGIKEKTPAPFILGPTLSYFFHSLLQEMIARGFLQSSFQRFLNDKRGIRSVVLASVLFGVFHLHFGVTAVLMTAVSGILFGMLYLRHRNLVGPTLVHFFAGGAAFWSGMI
ncbi:MULTISPECIES: cyclic nucleotide-binding domain-containing protein [Thalassospira]|uniref:Cyclic nucleotide-binding domain-containing protein n=1 Tax=Thalassospira aquimaris TaxID=3037796 RepID=A0ABT6GEG4_9PROT|nr:MULTISPECIES: cyclic nucleotide-binding domain-containing protein [Thalassospira]MDG4720074.1 cyclic nucleotide-binding domain-containing protein [Thalassospira sp. FZY0004]